MCCITPSIVTKHWFSELGVVPSAKVVSEPSPVIVARIGAAPTIPPSIWKTSIVLPFTGAVAKVKVVPDTL